MVFTRGAEGGGGGLLCSFCRRCVVTQHHLERARSVGNSRGGLVAVGLLPQLSISLDAQNGTQCTVFITPYRVTAHIVHLRADLKSGGNQARRSNTEGSPKPSLLCEMSDHHTRTSEDE